MSLTQGSSPEQAPEQAETERGPVRRRLWAACFALLAFVIGTFLMVFPWLDAWTLNHLPSLFPSVLAEFQDLWDDPFFKGAVSGLGVLNVYISLRQIASIRRRKI